jgi:hypothetical protein
MFFINKPATILAGCLLAVSILHSRVADAAPPTTVTPIHQIQGSGFLSPINNTIVMTEGVVTAKVSDGYYIQTIFGSDDGNALTSQGLFIYTNTAPAANIASGALVKVIGTVEEYRPASDPHQLTFTRLKSITSTTVVSTANTLPSAITLVEADLNDGNSIDYMERYEGMRVRVSQLKVTQPVGGQLNEATGIATLDGVFYGVLPNITRPAHEPGIGITDSFVIPTGKSIPFFDTNPENLRVDGSRLTGASALSPDVDDVVNNLVGVLDYKNGSPSLLVLPNASTSVSLGSYTSGLGRGASYEDISVAAYNLDRFFDTLDNPLISEPVLTAQTFQNRIEKTANVICSYIYGPDVLAVYEVENLNALQALADKANTISYCTEKYYTPLLIESNDPEGLDIGLIVSGKILANNKKKFEVLSIEQIESSKTFQNASGSTELLYDRASLLVKIRANTENNNTIDMTLIISDLMSDKNINSPNPGSNGWSTIGLYVRKKRAAQALSLAQIIQNRQVAEPSEKIILLGNFKAPTFSDGYVDVMGILTGRETQAAHIVEYVDSPITSALTNLSNLSTVGTESLQSPENQNTSIARGNTHRSEHIVLNQSAYSFFRKIWGVPRVNSGYGIDLYNDVSVPVRASRYEPTLAYLSNDLLGSADVYLTLGHPYELSNGGLNAAPVETYFTMFVASSGPSGISNGTINVDIDVAGNFINVADDPGYSIRTCDKTSPTIGSTHFSCPFDNGESSFGARTLRLNLNADSSFDGKTISLNAGVSSPISDPNLSNNSATFTASFSTKTDLALSLNSGAATTGVSPGETISVFMTAGNLTPVPGLNAIGTFELTGVTPGMISTPDSKCTQITAIGPDKLIITCNFMTITPVSWSNSQQTGYFYLTLPLNYSNPSLQVSAVLSTTSEDLNTSNNIATSLSITALVDANIETIFTMPAVGFVAKNRPNDYFVTVKHSGPVAPLNPTVEFIIDAIPTNITVTAPQEGSGSYTCLPPVSIGIGKSKVLCSGIAPVYWDATFKITATPYIDLNIANGSFKISALARSLRPDFSMANNEATLVVPADYSTDIGVFNAFQSPTGVVEPADIVYSVSPSFDLAANGNYPINTRMSFKLNALLSGSQVSVFKGVMHDPRVPMSCSIYGGSDLASTIITCTDILSPLYEEVTVIVKTNPGMQGRTLTLTATVTNDLFDTNLANNTSIIAVRVIAKTNNCIALNKTCSDGSAGLPIKIISGNSVALRANYQNYGPSTAKATKIKITAAVPIANLSANTAGCSSSVAGANVGESEFTCSIGDFLGNSAIKPIDFSINTAGVNSDANIAYSARIDSPTEDTDSSNNLATDTIQVIPDIDLSTQVLVKGTEDVYSKQHDFYIFSKASGNNTNAASSVLNISIDAPFATIPANFYGLGWSCYYVSGTLANLKLSCTRNTAIANAATDQLVLSFKPVAMQRGQNITVTAEHVYLPNALAGDRNLSNNTSSATRRITAYRTMGNESATTPIQNSIPAASLNVIPINTVKPVKPLKPIRKPFRPVIRQTQRKPAANSVNR